MLSTYLTDEAARRLRQGMPWVFRDEIVRMDGMPEAGEPVHMMDERGESLGLGDVDLEASLAIRRLGLLEETPDGLIPRQIRRALQRRAVFVQDPRYCRIVNDDGDGMPGLIVDRYDQHYVLQTSTRAMDSRVDEISRALIEVMDPRSILLRNDSARREALGLPAQRPHVLFGTPPRWTRLLELSTRITVDLTLGLGTGFSYEQRQVRRLVRRMAHEARVLDVCCGLGASTVHAGLGGAQSILSFEQDPDALDLARENSEINGLVGRGQILEGDAQTALSRGEENFDLVLFDPKALELGIDEFTELLRSAIRMTRRGGRMIVSGYHPPLPQGSLDAIVAEACEAERRLALRLARPSLPADFPMAIGSPTGEPFSAMALELD
ncbi:MAG: class I SAM-dependent rRNA methyltransferase [Myxococcaceae bacterium]